MKENNDVLLKENLLKKKRSVTYSFILFCLIENIAVILKRNGTRAKPGRFASRGIIKKVAK